MKIKLLLIFALTTTLLTAQTAKTIQFGGLTRDYLEYVPAIYDGSTPVPIVLCLHGLGDNMNNFYGIGMNYIADTANFIVLVPEARFDAIITNGNAWNSGASYMGYQVNQNINDAGFLNALLDTVIATYNIDETRIFTCGFSLGSFMCHRLACEYTDRFAAIATVAGTIGTSLTCNPSGEIPVCHFHGTADGTIAYTGNMFGNDAEELVNYWVTNNNCTSTPIHTALPDLVADGYTIDHYLYPNGNNGTDVEFYKVNGADHEWLFYPNNDITYTLEIWKFFMKYPKGITNKNNIKNNIKVEVFPNPSNGEFFIISNKHINIEIIDLQGKAILKKIGTENGTCKIDLSEFSKGLYFARIITNEETIIKKIILE